MPKKRRTMGVFRSDRFNDLLRSRSLSQKDIADKIGASTKQVSRWSTGKSAPETTTIRALAIELGVSVDYLLGLTDEPKGHITLSGDEQALLDAFRRGDFQSIMNIFGQKIAQALRKRDNGTPGS